MSGRFRRSLARGSEFAEGWGGLDVEVDFLVQEAIFMADHEAGFRIVLGEEESPTAGVVGHIEDEIARVGLAGVKGLR